MQPIRLRRAQNCALEIDEGGVVAILALSEENVSVNHLNMAVEGKLVERLVASLNISVVISNGGQDGLS